MLLRVLNIKPQSFVCVAVWSYCHGMIGRVSVRDSKVAGLNSLLGRIILVVHISIACVVCSECCIGGIVFHTFERIKWASEECLLQDDQLQKDEFETLNC
jgi:hypothetical protein